MLKAAVKRAFTNNHHEIKWLTEESNKATGYTPDIARLEARKLQLLFVYNEMMCNRRQYDLIKDRSVNLAVAYTENKFSVYKKKLGLESFPIPLAADRAVPAWTTQPTNTAPPGIIRGELHAVEPFQYLKLDKHMANGVEFVRVRMNLIVPYARYVYNERDGIHLADSTYHKVRAWMYVGVPDYWQPQLDAGYLFTPVRLFRPKNYLFKLENYYYYTPMEATDK